MLGQIGAEQSFVGRGVPAAMGAADLKRCRARLRRDKPDDPRPDHNQREWDVKEEDADESQSGQNHHRPALQRPAADPLHRVQNDRQHRRLEAKK